MRHILHALLVLVIVSFMKNPVGAADDWPAWRGPQASGIVSESTVPLTWTPDSAVWKTKIPGTGYSSPVLRQGKVFLTTSGVKSSTDRCVLCVDFSTGKIEWTRPVFDSPIEKMHRMNSPASSTPACDEQRVFVAFAENGFIGVGALDFDGRTVWKKRAGEFVSRHGLHSCPVVWQDRIFISGTQDGDDAFVAALDAETGKILWKTQRPQKVRSFSPPFVMTVKDTPQVVVSGANQTIAYNANSGEQIWCVDGPASKTVSSIATDGKLLFVPGGRDNTLLAIDPTGTDDVTKTHIVWKAEKGIPYVPSGVLKDGRFHLVSDDGIYTCYDTQTGKVIKQTRAAGRTSASLLLVGDRILLTEDSGTTHILTADGTGREVGRNEFGETTYASHCIANGCLFVRTVKHLMCFGGDLGTTADRGN